ncbi:MAG: hypothetical protein E7172_04510 [Firmicutes bacterium]|nr:hypothetical protein [Bacillota bacterium]
MTGSLKYLIHYMNDNKYQLEDCVSNCDLYDRLKKLIHGDKTEEEIALNLLEYIDTYPDYLTFKQFFVYVCKSGQYAVFRRSQSIFSRLLDEHNREYLEK